MSWSLTFFTLFIRQNFAFRWHCSGTLAALSFASIDMVNADVFGTGYDYIALGHIHNPQNISDRIRYSGSPLPVSFDEDFHHSVLIVTIGAHGDTPEVETIAPSFRVLRC